MNLAVAIATGLALGLSSTATYPQELLDGVYEGFGEDVGTLRVIVDGRDVGVTIKAAGCLGTVEGYLARNKAGDLFMISSTYKEVPCAIAIDPHGKFSFSMKQGPECSYHHGAACSFNGLVERVR